MDNFVEKCLSGEECPENLDTYIARWHSSNSDLDLPDYLGLSLKEYKYFLESTKTIKEIINERKK